MLHICNGGPCSLALTRGHFGRNTDQPWKYWKCCLTFLPSSEGSARRPGEGAQQRRALFCCLLLLAPHICLFRESPRNFPVCFCPSSPEMPSPGPSYIALQFSCPLLATFLPLFFLSFFFFPQIIVSSFQSYFHPCISGLMFFLPLFWLGRTKAQGPGCWSLHPPSRWRGSGALRPKEDSPHCAGKGKEVNGIMSNVFLYLLCRVALLVETVSVSVAKGEKNPESPLKKYTYVYIYSHPVKGTCLPKWGIIKQNPETKIGVRSNE